MNIIFKIVMITLSFNHPHKVKCIFTKGEMYIYTRFGSARGFSAVYYRVDPAKLLYNALSLPVNHNVIV